MAEPLYIGLDLSTQQLKCIVLDLECKVKLTIAVNFDKDLPQFGTNNGVHQNGDVVTSPVSLWLAAVDLLFTKLAKSGEIDLRNVRAISGCGQQHGTVYWSEQAESILASELPLTSEEFLNAFTKIDCPIWMDSSTGEQCDRLESKVGGKLVLAQITGSRAYHRFSGSQIAKVAQYEQDVYSKTQNISLVSSFLGSLLIGKIAPIDYADGSGMNILDIHARTWSQDCLKALAPLDTCSAKFAEELKLKLGDPVSSYETLGKISKPLAGKYGFSPDCQILAFTGDNPASLVGLCVDEETLLISLGTSDTAMFTTKSPNACTDGHLFVHPNAEGWMGMACFKNGSLTRERIRKSIGFEWVDLNAILAKTDSGNGGNIGFYYDHNEIAPPIKAGDYRYPVENRAKFTPEIEIRAVLEGQFISKLVYAKRLGWNGKGKIVVTGGASINSALLQLIADIFDLPVFTIAVPDSAALGGALRARYGKELGTTKITGFEATNRVEPRGLRDVYKTLIEKYEELEVKLRKEHGFQE
ncbi:unnamed protein product, partial [Mesorhabditis spiculigera]